MAMPLAAVTMAYNEGPVLRAWLAHYGREVGLSNCFVLDHGSSDGSIVPGEGFFAPGGASAIRIPRSPQDDPRRCQSVSHLTASLLSWYDAVLYTDADELLVADPARHPDLSAFAATLPADAVVTAHGFDVIHVPDEEATLDWERPFGAQRTWLRFSSAMCKPVMVRRPVSWAPGFHCIDAAPSFGELFLLHLRYADLRSGLDRLRRTRAQPWASPDAGSHQRMSDADWEGMLRSMAGLPKREGVSLLPDDAVLASWRDRVTASAVGREHDSYRIDLHISGDELWAMPPRLRDRLSRG